MRMVARWMLGFVLAAGLGTLGAGCGDDAADPIPECEAIVEACHPLDPGTGPIHDCHENAEAATSAAQCTAISASCLALCRPASDGGVDGSRDAN